MWLVGALAGYGLFHLLLIVIVILILFRFFGPPARRPM
jgi:Sec-independent protein translocase protein TatA